MAEQVIAPMRDRRRHRRFACSGQAEVVAIRPRMLFRGKVRDISRSGCFIESAARINLTRLAEVELHLTARGVNLKSLARLIEILPGKGVRFEFLLGDPRMDATFLELIDRLKADEANDRHESGN